MDADAIRRWLDLRDRVKAAEADLSELKHERDRAEQDALMIFAREGVDSVRLDAHTVTLTRTLHASVRAHDRPEVIRVLDQLGMSDLAPRGIHAATLSAYVRELDRDDEALPEELTDVVQVAELFGLSAVRSTRTRVRT